MEDVRKKIEETEEKVIGVVRNYYEMLGRSEGFDECLELFGKSFRGVINDFSDDSEMQDCLEKLFARVRFGVFEEMTKQLMKMDMEAKEEES